MSPEDLEEYASTTSASGLDQSGIDKTSESDGDEDKDEDGDEGGDEEASGDETSEKPAASRNS